MKSGKQLVYDALSNLGTATSNQLTNATGLHSASVDKLLKGMVENGELTREKKTPAEGGREVFHYSITITEDEEVDETEEDEDTTEAWGDDDEDGGWDDDDYDEMADMSDDDDDELTANREDADTDISYGPANAVVQPNIVFLVRKDDIPGFTYGNGGHKFAREISQFVKFGSRRFERHGNAVISIFISETYTQLITAHMQAVLPDITFGVTNDIESAIEYIQSYSEEVGKTFSVDGFRTFYQNWYDMNSYYLPSHQRRDTAILVPVEPEAPKGKMPEGSVQPVIQNGDVIERLARNGMEYMNMSHTEMAEVFQKLANFYLDYND